jgi:hypothetical protein
MVSMPMGWDYVSELRPPTGQLFVPQVTSMERHGGMILRGENRRTWREKPVPVPLLPPQIPHELTRAWSHASAVRGQRLTTWATAPVCEIINIWQIFSLWDTSSLQAFRPESDRRTSRDEQLTGPGLVRCVHAVAVSIMGVWWALQEWGGGGAVPWRLLLPFVSQAKQALARLMCKQNQQHWWKTCHNYWSCMLPFIVGTEQGWPNSTKLHLSTKALYGLQFKLHFVCLLHPVVLR